MKLRNLFQKIIFLYVVIVLASCKSMPFEIQTKGGTTSTDMSCIPPIRKLAYPVGIPRTTEATSEQIPPSSIWLRQSTLPAPINKNIPQVISQEKSIWVLSLDATQIFRYLPYGNEWKVYTTIDDIHAIPKNIFKSKDGELWGMDPYLLGDKSRKELPFLARFNESTDQFVSVSDEDNILRNLRGISYPIEVVVSSSGLFWFFASEKGLLGVGLYAYNPKTNTAEKLLSLEGGGSYVGPVISKDGSIWFFNGWEDKLYTYLPATKELQPYQGLPRIKSFESAVPLFFDRNGRLWIGNSGWIDFSNPIEPIWYQIIPSPVFLIDNGGFVTEDPEGPRSGYGLADPYSLFESSNGWLWFTSLRGIIRLDPEPEEWCLITTGESPVVEDDNGNLWIAVFDALYKYQINP